MKYSVIIPAAGSSSRVGTYDKLLFKINNQPVIKHSVANFFDDPDCKQIILVVPEAKFDFYKKMFNFYPKLLVVKGAATRFASVACGFHHVKQDYVLIHDGARPYVSMELIETIKQTLESHAVVIPTIPVIDSMLQVNTTGQVNYVNRDHYQLVQTPQGFETKLLAQAYTTNANQSTYSDEGSLVLATCPQADLVTIPGETGNKKITYESDFEELFCLD